MAVFVFRYFCFKCWIFRTSKKHATGIDSHHHRLGQRSRLLQWPGVRPGGSTKWISESKWFMMLFWFCLLSLSIFTCMLDILYDHIGTCGPCSWGWKAKVSSGKLCVDIAHIYTGYIDTVVLCICRVFLWANCVSIYIHTCKSHHSLSVSPSGRPPPYCQ